MTSAEKYQCLGELMMTPDQREASRLVDDTVTIDSLHREAMMKTNLSFDGHLRVGRA